MATYKEGTSVYIAARQSAEAAEVIGLCQELASLRDEPLGSAVKRFLREMLPASIAALREKVKVKPLT